MKLLTLEEAIKNCNEKVKELSDNSDLIQFAIEQKQISEWLTELKELKEKY